MDYSGLYAKVEIIEDFPKPGVSFKNLNPLYYNADSFSLMVDWAEEVSGQISFNKVIAPESRGFIFGSILASLKKDASFLPLRKFGKLPFPDYFIKTTSEYANETFVLRNGDLDSVKDRIILFDDVLATGNTLYSILDFLILNAIKIVGIAVLADLTYIKSDEKSKLFEKASFLKIPIFSLLLF